MEQQRYKAIFDLFKRVKFGIAEPIELTAMANDHRIDGKYSRKRSQWRRFPKILKSKPASKPNC